MQAGKDANVVKLTKQLAFAFVNLELTEQLTLTIVNLKLTEQLAFAFVKCNTRELKGSAHHKSTI